MALLNSGGSVLGSTEFGVKAASSQAYNNTPLTLARTSSSSQFSVAGARGPSGAAASVIASRGAFSSGLTVTGQTYYNSRTATAGIAVVRGPGGTSYLTGASTSSFSSATGYNSTVAFQGGTISSGTNNLAGPTSATKGDLGSASGGTEAGYGQQGPPGSGTQPGSGGQAEVTCSICGGKIMSNFAGRLFFYINKFLQRFPNIVIPIGVILNYFRERGVIPGTTALTVCGACENKRSVKDPSDDSAKYAQAASIAQSVAPQIAEEEAKMGTTSGNGGNLVEIYAGHVYKKIGLAINTAPSYRVDRDCGYRNWGVATADKSTTGPNGFKTGEANSQYSFRLSRGAKCNHVQGLNPPAAPGGTYTIESANSVNIITGAQGFGVTTGGPVTIDGGITRISGPEVSVGGSTGRLLLGGDVINMDAKSIEMAPSDGHVYTRGTMSCSGNMIVGGHAHAESASIVKLATVGKNDDTKVSSSSNVYGGPAFWGGPVYEGIYASLREMVAHVTTNTTHPILLKEVGPISLRYPQTLLDNTLNMAYTLRPLELVPTGICIGATGVGIVFNFPHIHAMPDQPHSHGYRGPDIDYTSETAQQLRGVHAAGAMGHAPLQKKDTTVIDLFIAIWQVISAAWVAAGKVLLENNYIK